MKNDELASLGIQAFQEGEYETAIEYLSELVTRQPGLWTCRLYLAMAYQNRGEELKARNELNEISQWATDQSIRKKATDVLRALNARAATAKANAKNSSLSGNLE